MILRSFVVVFVSLATSFTFGNTVTPPNEAPLFPTRNNFFTIPFEIKADDAGELPVEVELTYSTDQGMNWFPYSRVRPENKQFLFKSSADGEYWFIFKTYGQDGLVKETRRRGPMLRVLVDTIPPKLTLSAEQKSTGEILIQWSVEDANLTRKTPQMQIAYSTGDPQKHFLSNWKPVSIDPQKIQSEGNKHQGELVIWPERGAVSFEIQAEISDMAGNREMQSRTVSLTTLSKEEDSNVLTESMQSSFQQSRKPSETLSLKSLSDAVPRRLPPPPDALERTTTVQTAKPLAVSLTPPRPSVQPTQPMQNSRPIPSQVAGLSTINESLQSFHSAPRTNERILDFGDLMLSEETKTEPQMANTTGRDSVLVGPILFPEDATDDASFSVGSPQAPLSDLNVSRRAFEFSLDESDMDSYEDDFEDGPKLSVPNPKYAPPPFDFDRPVLTEEYHEVSEQTEEQDSSPSIAIEPLEKSNAFIRITKITHLRELRLNQILVKWETDEGSWTGSDNARVHIFRGSTQQGPWMPIAVAQQNTGSYAWTVSQEDRNPFYILLQCEGEKEESVKELVSDLTMQPIQLPMALFNRG